MEQQNQKTEDQITDESTRAITELSQIVFRHNKEKGFWDKPRNVGELLMLVNSELCEGLEAHRTGKMAKVEGFKNHLGEFTDVATFKEAFLLNLKDTFEDEMADAVIRIMDLAGGLGIDLGFHVKQKLAYNRTRPFKHGKSY